MYPIKNLIAKIDTKNATTQPTIKSTGSIPVNPPPSTKNFKILRALAPNITGIAKKNVNSAATFLETPINKAPKIVAPERDVPGINDNTWNPPIKSAVW